VSVSVSAPVSASGPVSSPRSVCFGLAQLRSEMEVPGAGLVYPIQQSDHGEESNQIHE
jgi:hypothetical protein